MKKIIKLALAGVMLATGLTAVACSRETVHEKYKYPYELITNISADDNMKVDGVLDENVYTNNRYMEYSLSNTNVKITTHFGEKGLYVGCVIKDNYIYHNKPYLMDANSSMRLYVSTIDLVKFSTAAVEIAADTQNTWSGNYVLFLAKTTVQGGEVNTGNSEGMTVEFYLPWQQLGLESAPEQVKLFPSYNHVSAQGVSSGLKLSPIGNSGKPYTYYVFNSDGYINEDIDGAVVGDAITGISKSSGWDLTGLSSENPTVRSVEDDAQILFFKGARASSFVIETTVTMRSIIRGNAGPKVGLLTGYDGNEMSATYNQKSGFLLDVSKSYYDGNASKEDKVYAKCIDMYTTGWVATDFVYTNTKPLGSGGLNYEDGVHLKVVKDGKWFYYYVEDVLCYINGVDYLADNVMPGIISIGCEAVFSNMKFTNYTGREDELRDLLEEDAYLLDAQVTGGGNISFTKPAVIRNPDRSVVVAAENFAQFHVQTALGNRLTQFKVNGMDCLDALKAGIKEGNYVFENVSDDITISANFEAFTQYSTMQIKFGSEASGAALSNAVMTVINKDDPTMIYNPRLSVKTEGGRRLATTTINLPAGDYLVRCAADGYVTKVVTATIKQADIGKTVTYDTIALQTRTAYGENANGDGWTLQTNGDIEYIYESDANFGLGKNAVMYFSETSEKCILSATIYNVQKGEGSRDLKAGFVIAGEVVDGKSIVRAVIADQVNKDIKLLTMTPGHAWSDFKAIPSDCANLTGEGFEITLLKESMNGICTIYVFVNGNYFNKITFNVSGATACGLVTIGSTAWFNNTEYVTDFTVAENVARYDSLKKQVK